MRYPKKEGVTEKRKSLSHQNSETYDFNFSILAERGGFEPPIPFRGIHAFQACLFNHSSTSPCSGRKSKGSFWNYQMFGQIILKVRSSNQCRNGLSTLNKTYLSLP